MLLNSHCNKKSSVQHNFVVVVVVAWFLVCCVDVILKITSKTKTDKDQI